jgi:hypothetical protein
MITGYKTSATQEDDFAYNMETPKADQGAELVIRVVRVSGPKALVSGPKALVSAFLVPVSYYLGGELLGSETSSMGRCRARENVGPVLAQIHGPNLSVAALVSPNFVLDL